MHYVWKDWKEARAFVLCWSKGLINNIIMSHINQSKHTKITKPRPASSTTWGRPSSPRDARRTGWRTWSRRTRLRGRSSGGWRRRRASGAAVPWWTSCRSSRRGAGCPGRRGAGEIREETKQCQICAWKPNDTRAALCIINVERTRLTKVETEKETGTCTE